MGVGTPLDILEAVHRGVDMFDCIMPTQLAQRGRRVYLARIPADAARRLQILRGAARSGVRVPDMRALQPSVSPSSDEGIRDARWQLLGKHNIHFYHQLMRDIRASILEDRFLALYHEKRAFLAESDLENPIVPMKRKKPRAMRLGDYEIHIAREGFASIRQASSGEIMHMRTPPMEEARLLYVEQAELAARLRESSEPLVIWDVGLGAAANAMAAIQCYEAEAAKGAVRPMRIISFENDLDSLKLAVQRNDLFPYLRHGGPPALLQAGEWQSKQHIGLSWVLQRGDFLEMMRHVPAPPDLIFYDMFSSKTSSGVWGLEAFRQISGACAGRAAELYTYVRDIRTRGAARGGVLHRARSQHWSKGGDDHRAHP
jgi:queuine tRNA-ribosyltransferase